MRCRIPRRQRGRGQARRDVRRHDRSRVSEWRWGRRGGLFAFPSGEFLGTGGHAGTVVFKVEDGNGVGRGVRRKGGQGFGQVGGEVVNEAVERAGVELQSGEDGKDAGRLLIGIAGVGGCLTDELGQCRGVMFGEIKGEVQRRATAVALGVVKVAALECDGAKQGVNGNGAVVVNGLAGKR